jgi:lysophospholipase L1-like esterase
MQAQAAARRFAPDGLHPSAEAHLAWAVALLPKVLERVATAAPVSATLP